MTPEESLTLKLVVTPALIGAASLAGRRWGQGVSGWIVGLPLTSGPVAFFLVVDHGAAFAVAARLPRRHRRVRGGRGGLPGVQPRAHLALSRDHLRSGPRHPTDAEGRG